MGLPKWMLVAIEGPFRGQRFAVPESGVTLGREDDNTLVLEDDNVSRHHATVCIENSWPVLQDLKSRNGTFVNNQKVARLELQEGDKIALGAHLFRVTPLAKEEAAGLLAQGNDVERTVVYQRSQARRRGAALATTALEIHPPQGGAGGQVPNLAAPPPSPDTASQAIASGGAPGSASQPLDGHVSGFESGSGMEPNEGDPQGSSISDDQPRGFEAGDEKHVEHGMRDGHDAAPGYDQVSYGEAPIASDRGDDAQGYPSDSQNSVAQSATEQKIKKWMLAATAFLFLAVAGGGAYITQLDRLETGEQPAAAAQALAKGPADALDPRSIETPVSCERPVLTEEEQTLQGQDRIDRANEVFDEGERFMASEKLKGACTQFEKALVLNPDCKICIIRLSKVKKRIKASLAKYKGDAIRSYQAMEYSKARRYWEMALELESDPEGRRILIDGIRKAKSQLHKQSYR